MNDEGTKHMPECFDDGDVDTIKAEQARIMSMIKRDETTVRRLRICVVILWSVFVVGMMMGSIVSTMLRQHGLRSSSIQPFQGIALVPILIVALVLILIVAVVCTVSLYIRSRSVSQHQILAVLAGIEKALQELSGKTK